MTRRRAITGALAGALLAGLLWLRCGPLPRGFLDPERHVSIEIVDRAGRPLYEALSAEGGRSRWLSAGEIAPLLAAATVAAEDRRYFQHPGVDPIAIARAAWRNLRAGRAVEGASTITQQVVKRLTGRPRSLAGKLEEMVLALRLEHRLGKREILALYLSLAPYGNQFQGAAAAARGYFGCDPNDLTAAQAAFLAGLPQRPTAFDPRRRFAEAQARGRRVLARMESQGRLSARDAGLARGERLRLRAAAATVAAPHFTERVIALHGGAGVRRIETTLDAPLQEELRGILAAHRASLELHGASNVAVAVLDNASAQWLAWEGSGNYFDGERGGAIDGVLAPRQPGSALKPFTYALAFESGSTPATVLPDIPSHFPTAQAGILYGPRNYDGLFRGPLRARAALAGSINVPAVRALSRAGVPSLLRLLRAAGLTTLDRSADHYGLGLTMGDAEVRLDELIVAYAALASGGLARPARTVLRVMRADGSTQENPAQAARRVLSPRTAWWITDILSDPRARAFTFGSGGSLDFPFPVAVKTGTSEAYRDNWTVGYTREVTVGVWVGNFDRKPLRNSSGVTGAAPIFHAVLLAAQRRVQGRLPGDADPPILEMPPELSPVSICALSGLSPSDDCPSLATEMLPADSRLEACRWHRRSGGKVSVAWPGEYVAWARAQGRFESSPPAAPGRPAPDTAGLAIASPPPQAIYLRDPTLRRSFQTLPLRASADPRARSLTWSVDGRVVGVCAAGGSIAWPLEPGAHTIQVADELGRKDETTILVK